MKKKFMEYIFKEEKRREREEHYIEYKKSHIVPYKFESNKIVTEQTITNRK